MRKTEVAVIGVWALTIMAVVGVLLSLSGCASLGLPIFGNDSNKEVEQMALEGAALVAVPLYIKMAADMPEGMTHAEHLKMAVDAANSFVLTAYPQLGMDAEQLLQSRVKDITNDKWNPQVKALYYYVYELLDFLEEGEDD